MVLNAYFEIDNIGEPNNEFIIEELDELKEFNWSLNKINIIHQNIRTMENLDDFLLFLDSIKSNVRFHIIILTECRLNESYLAKQITGYHEYHTTQQLNQNSGVVAYISDDIQSQVQEICISQSNCLKIIIKGNLCILAIYRSPSFNDIHEFLMNLVTELKKCGDFKQQIIMGDININTYGNIHRQCHDYLCAMAENNFAINIKAPTRVQDNSMSCLDHINTRNITAADAFIIHNTITDHYTTAVSIPDIYPTKHVKTKHFTSSICYEGLIKDLNNETWQDVYRETEVNNALNVFINKINMYIIKKSIEKQIAHKKIKLTPWITSGIVKSIHKRNHLHKVATNDPHNCLKQQNYRRYRNICKNVMRNAKEQYYKIQLNRDPSSKNMWNIVKQITNTKNTSDSNIKELKIGNSSYTDLDKIACYTNQYFSTVGSKLADNILSATKETEDSLASAIEQKQIPYSFNFPPTTNEEVLKNIDSLNSTHSKGPDSLNTHILKIIKHNIALPLSFIFNKSFSTGVFPDHLKKSIVIPIYKSGLKNQVENYRPISLLSAISKIIEKIFKNRLSNYVESRKLLSTNQFGFRSGTGTDDAIAQLTKHISGNIDRGKKNIAL